MPSRCFAQLVSAPGAEKRLRSSLEAFGSPTRGSQAVSQADSTTRRLNCMISGAVRRPSSVVHRDFGRSCPDRASLHKVLAHLTYASRSDAIVFLPNPKRPLRIGQQFQ